MQSIYFFRDADAELFPRVEQIGLEIPNELPLRLEPVELQANFRSAALLVERINDMFAKVFALDDGSGIEFAESLPARDDSAQTGPHLVARAGPAHAPALRIHAAIHAGQLARFRGRSKSGDRGATRGGA